MTTEEQAAEEQIEVLEGRIAVMRAYLDGKQIQVRGTVFDWSDVTNPSFDWSKLSYRVKPEPKAVWINEYDYRRGSWHSSPEDARRCAIERGLRRVAVKYVECVDD